MLGKGASVCIRKPKQKTDGQSRARCRPSEKERKEDRREPPGGTAADRKGRCKRRERQQPKEEPNGRSLASESKDKAQERQSRGGRTEQRNGKVGRKISEETERFREKSTKERKRDEDGA